MRALDVDERTDIFSLGVVLYEMLTGTAPFERKTVGDTIAAILQYEPAPIALPATTVPAELQKIITKALRKDRDDRYQAMGDIASDLKRVGKRIETDQQSISAVLSGNAPTIVTAPEMVLVETPKEMTARTGESSPTRTASSAEYIVGEIKQHKRGTVVVLALLLAAIAGVAYFAYFAPASKAAIKTVAILPFVNASNNPDMEYLSDGVSESLINSLSPLGPQLTVIASRTSFKYKGQEVDLQKVAKALGVQAIVTGRVVQRGDQTQISAELVNTQDGTQMWGDKYNFKAADLVKVESEISQQIAEKLRLRLTTAEQQQLAKDKQVNPQAYDLLINGSFHQAKTSPEDRKKAIQYFKEALDIDPNYALAHARLGGAYLDLGLNTDLDPKVTVPLAEAEARKALDLDESLANAHVVWGRIKLAAWDWAGAEREFNRALDLDSNLATAHSWYSLYLSCQGRHDQALISSKRARELDPLFLPYTANIGLLLYFERRYDQAIEQLKKTFEIQPDYAYATIFLGYVYSVNGMYPEAVVEFKKAQSLGADDASLQCYLGYALAQAGQRPEAEVILKQLQTTKVYVSPGELAVLYAGLGEREQAFQSLERACAEHDPQTQYLKVEPHYDSLRTDPRFAQLIRKVGLTP